ncbi:MAG: aldehyde dehydrogenase EutE [Spirochaetales bacterium]|nr:aldehyde dehydrogenase EutE [Spirochaetales bacterium]
MEVNEESIRSLVEQVVAGLKKSGAREDMFRFSGLFSDMDAAVWAARKAQKDLVGGTLLMRRKAVENIRRIVLDNLETLSKMAVEETGFGRVEDKIAKNRLAAEMTPGVEDLSPESYSDDHGLTLTERAPYGVIGAIAPSTNPTETIINNGISMIAGGNAVVFNSHPGARKVSAYMVGLLNDAVMKAGGPENVFCTLTEPTIESATAMMSHPLVDLLVVTGGPGVVRAAMKSGKKVIAAGPGNPPVVVDETADLEKAGRDIVMGAGFDNNIICIDEKEILAVRSIADPLKEEMKKHGAFEVKGADIDRLTGMILTDPGRPGHEGAANRGFIGKNASVIAAKAGLSVPEDTRILLVEVDKSHPLVWTEQLMPVIPLVRLENADEAIDFALECEHGFRHTASMHSLNIAKLSRMARVMNCSLFVKNGSNFNGMAAGGAGYTSFTIASPTGEGFTRARTFTRERRCSLIDYFRIV